MRECAPRRMMTCLYTERIGVQVIQHARTGRCMRCVAQCWQSVCMRTEKAERIAKCSSSIARELQAFATWHPVNARGEARQLCRPCAGPI